MTIFNNVEFVKSIARTTQLPKDNKSEIAFIGRSNVGKSTLLNSLCGRKNIAKISSTPGKTREINFYLVNKSYYFVDLPGYGYARLPKNVSESWRMLIEQYLLNSINLLIILLLIDSRHDPIKSDMKMIKWLNNNNLPFAVVLTKVDKISNDKQVKQLNYFKHILPDNHVLSFSYKNDDLKIKLSSFIYNIISHL